MRSFRIILLFLSLAFHASAQTDPVIYSVYLIGNTGNDTIASEALQLLAFECFDDTSSTLLVLGDNVFPSGNNPGKSPERQYTDKRKLLAQLEVLATYQGNCYVLPGSIDWSRGKPSGLKAVKNQQKIVDEWSTKFGEFGNKGAVYFSQPGLPGPQSVQLNSGLRLLMLDSQWWLQQDLLHPVGKFAGLNRKQTSTKAFQQLDSLLAVAQNAGEIVILGAHHPLYSNGKHSHRMEPLRTLLNYTPLHFISWFGLNRILRQDIPQPRYHRYKKRIEAILKKYPEMIYVSGHEHSMQYMVKGNLHHIVSGSGSTLSTLDRYHYPSKFMDDQQPGFFSLTFHASGSVYLHAFGIRDRGEYWKTLVMKKPIKP